MSRLILVRHAQASFFADNYDQLSSLGERQAVALGEHWARYGLTFDEIIVGPRHRQMKTEQLVRSFCIASGLHWPEPQIWPEFDEHAVDQLLGQPLEELLKHHPQLYPLAADYRGSDAPHDLQRNFQRLFEAICHLWRTAAPGTAAIESWNNFQARVESGLRRVLATPGKNRTVAVFTSVGNITVALGYALGCSPAQAFELGWRLKNCSLTELIFSGDRVTLDQFNCHAHLTDPDTWTFR